MSQRSVTRRAPPAGEAMKRAIEKLTSDVRKLQDEMVAVDKSFQYMYEDMDRDMKALEKRVMGSSGSSSKKRKSVSSKDDDSSDDEFMGDFVKQYNAAVAAQHAAKK